MKTYFIILILINLICSNCKNTPSSNSTKEVIETSTKENRFVLVEPDAGKVWNVFGLKIVGKIMSEDTGGNYSVIMSNTPPQGGPPPHVHEHEDEAFYVVKGKYLFTCGDEKIEANSGTLVHLPRGIPHSFQNIGDSTGVMLNTITPGGFENFFEEIDQLPKDQPLDRKKVTEIATTYGLKFLPTTTK